jgi:outer membrane protein assembly factor BamB
MRRFSVRLLLTAAVALALAPVGAQDWPQWRGPQADGTWPAPPLADSWPAEGLSIVWRQPIAGGYSGIAVVGDRLWTQDYRKDEGSEVERVVCRSTADGSLVWEHQYPVVYGKLDYGFGPRATPTVHDGRVYTLGAVGHLECCDAATGEPRWSHDLAAEYDVALPDWGIAGSPVVFVDLVIVHVGGRPDACYVAFDRRGGREVWRAGNDPPGYGTPIVVQAAGQPLLVGWTPQHVLGLDPRSGQILWQVPYEVTYGVSIATPIHHRGLVFVAGYWEGAKAIRLGADPHDAELAWEENRNLRGLMCPPLVRGELAWLLDKAHGLTCFRLETGEKLWDDGHQLTPRGRNPQLSLAWIGDTDRAVALNSDGDLILVRLTADGCQELARSHAIDPTESNPIWAHPAFAGRRIYARSDAEIVCVELPAAE